LLLLSDTDEKACDFLANRLIHEAKAGFQKNGWELSLSYGTVTETGVTRSVDELLRAAADSMYQQRSVVKQHAAEKRGSAGAIANA
jgi:hypothetical protein